MRKTLIASLLAGILPLLTLAGGFQINALGMKSTAMGGAFTGVANDASASFLNPGGMTFLEHSQISAGTTLLFPSASYLSQYSGNTDMEKSTFALLHLYGVVKIDEKSAFGLSVNTPYGLGTKWPENWTGKYITRETKISSLYVQPTYSYQLSETFGIGGGPVIAFGKATIKKALAYSGNSSDNINVDLEGKATGFGFNIGMLLKPNEDFSVGLTYRSAVKMKIKDGDATFSEVPSSLTSTFPSSTKFNTEITLPSTISLGASMNITRELMLCLDVNYTTWNSFDTLEFNFPDNADLNNGSGKFYENVFAIRAGAQYKINDRLDVRGGVAFDKSPVQDNYLSPELPDADKFIFSLGGTIRFGENFSVDLAYMVENFREREVNNKETNFGGNYKSLVNIGGITLNYQF